MILEALRSQTVRNIRIEVLGDGTFLSIAQYHAHHVAHLYLTTLGPEGSSLSVILAQCPGLRTLKVDLVWFGVGLIDIRHLIGEPWKCTLLEELELPITLDRRCKEASLKNIAADEKEDLAKTSKMVEWQQAEAVFMKRLGSLTRLRRLNLHGRFDRKSKPSEMSWQLKTGLGHLQHLDRLETLILVFQKYFQGIPEFQWMKQHFKSLSTLKVHNMGDDNKREWMKQALA
ncbi:hypothetical protein BGZ73_006966 [Actinomortierella ambigua]|nr:hypothetical protein BGZ73_006966 [Actinomortierella ambigua]